MNGTRNLKRQLCSLESEHDVPLEPVQLERVETFRIPPSRVVLGEHFGGFGSVWPQRLRKCSLRSEAIAGEPCDCVTQTVMLLLKGTRLHGLLVHSYEFRGFGCSEMSAEASRRFLQENANTVSKCQKPGNGFRGGVRSAPAAQEWL